MTTTGEMRVSAQQQSQPQVNAQSTGPQTITVLPATVNLSLYQGDDFYLDLAVSNMDTTPADLTGCTSTAQIRLTPQATVIEASFQASITTNVITLHLSHTDSVGVVNGFWDCQLVKENGDVVTLVAGSVTFTPEVTRP